MTKQAAEAGKPPALIESRRSRILQGVDRPLEVIGSGGVPLAREHVDHLVREAEELYWNELAWEEITDEEKIVGGHLTELVFPGFLAFVDGLLLESRPVGNFDTPQPHPEVVEEILTFLAGRHAEVSSRIGSGADSEKLVWARAMTSQLIDLVLYRLYGLSAEERERLENGG
jgi:hypothetical protein